MSGIQGKVALVTGASSGIGAAVAKRFAALGAHVLLHYNANEAGAAAVVEEARAAGGKIELLRGDLEDRAEAERVVNEAVEAFDRLDILVNNAGNMFGRTQIADASDEQYDSVVALNVGSVFFACRRAAQILRDQRSGTIINTTSIAARTGGGEGAGLYGSAKAFVSTLTRVLAKELAPFGVR